MSDEQRVHEITQEIINQYGKIDILVNNTGLWRMWKPFVETTSYEWKKRLSVNILGLMYFTHEVLPNMIENSYGRIINIGSVAGVYGRGISLIGAHTMARPKIESSAGLWTDMDDLKAILNLVKGKRLNFKDMICEIHSPKEANEIYNRLANEKSFPIGVLFDWSGETLY